MEISSPELPPTPSPLRGARPRRARLPLGARKTLERRSARRRILAHTRAPLSPAQRAFDPLTRPSRSPGRRRARFLLAVALSLAAHVGAITAGIVWRTGRLGPREREQVKIEVRQPPPPPEKKPEPPPPIEKPTRPPPRVAKVPPPAPPPPTKTPPVRVVGLSLESATEGGGGPAFAVGNTRTGETEKTAVAPKDVKPLAAAPPIEGPSNANRGASHIPIAGINYVGPQFKGGKHEPLYPETLRSQGIEADVTVMLTIDATGKVASVRIVKPAPYPEFNENAKAAALAQAFEPATRNGVPFSSPLTFTYHFRLEDQ